MRKLSFKSFLQRTLRELSAEGHTAPHQLAKELPECIPEQPLQFRILQSPMQESV